MFSSFSWWGLILVITFAVTVAMDRMFDRVRRKRNKPKSDFTSVAKSI